MRQTTGRSPRALHRRYADLQLSACRLLFSGPGPGRAEESGRGGFVQDLCKRSRHIHGRPAASRGTAPGESVKISPVSTRHRYKFLTALHIKPPSHSVQALELFCLSSCKPSCQKKRRAKCPPRLLSSLAGAVASAITLERHEN